MGLIFAYFYTMKSVIEINYTVANCLVSFLFKMSKTTLITNIKLHFR